MLKETPPFSVLSAGLAIALLLFFLALQVASDQPWLGLSAEPSAEGVRVVSIDSDGPAAGLLHEGELLLAVRSGAGTSASSSAAKRKSRSSEKALVDQACSAVSMGSAIIICMYNLF